nr:MAG TPA: hypothetical protein [Caudoviricetes sp.]
MHPLKSHFSRYRLIITSYLLIVNTKKGEISTI